MLGFGLGELPEKGALLKKGSNQLVSKKPTRGRGTNFDQ